MKRVNKFKIPTIIGIIILALGITSGVVLVGSKQIFRLGAASNNPPKDVRVSNISDTSFTVTWTTQKESQSYLIYGNNASNLSIVEEDEIKPAGFTHSVTVQGLLPTKTYYFKIDSGGEQYDNNSVPWQATTGGQLSPPQNSEIISGSLLTSTGTPASNAIIGIQIGGASPMSTTTSQSGAWIVPVSNLRTNDLNSYFSINSEGDIIEISAQAGPNGISSAQIYLKSAKPVPPMILGQVHDYKNLPPSSSEDVPDSDLELPDDYRELSRFSTDDDSSPNDITEVTLDSIEDGEIVTSEIPEFFGDGPPGTEISVTIQSEVISGKVIVGNNGSWEWTPPEDLPAGSHRISLSWRDSNGIINTISRSFIVQASEEAPAYEATPSAIPDITPSPISTSSASPSATIPPQPESGIPIPTIILYTLGLLLLVSASTLSYFAFEK